MFFPEMREKAKSQPPTLVKQPSATAVTNSASPPTQLAPPIPSSVSATNSGQLPLTTSTEPLEDIWQEWKSEQPNLATAAQIEELNRWVKPIPRAMFLLRRKLEDQSRRLEAMDVHLMTFLQEIEASTEMRFQNQPKLVQQNQPNSQPMTTGNWSALGVRSLEILLTAGVTVMLLQVSLPLWFKAFSVQPAIKQIDRRIQISGAQWNADNVPQVLAHRCAYLNGLIGSQT